MSDIAIRVERLGKLYRIGQREPYYSLRDTLMQALQAPFRAFSSNGRQSTDNHVWALRDVSFEVKRGEVVGIIGRNGAGKSTLLKILSRITEPTEGYGEIHGRVGSLLDVGTGFHPELTGRENIYLNGAILGMKKAEIDCKFNEIVAFAEVEKFIDTPVKHYSSGTFMRLAFSVAGHLEPEIMLVDEVLAVGDAAFQKKCLGKMGEVAREGRTILFVSHNMEAIQRLCFRCLWLNHGGIALEGDTETVVSKYLEHSYGDFASHYRAPPPVPTADPDVARLLTAEILNSEHVQCQHLRFGEPFTIRMVWLHSSEIPGASYTVRVYDRHDRFLFAANTINLNLAIEEKGVHSVDCRFDHNVLVPGNYYISIGCYVRPHTNMHVVDPCLKLVILDVSFRANASFNIVGNPAFALFPSWNKWND